VTLAPAPQSEQVVEIQGDPKAKAKPRQEPTPEPEDEFDTELPF